MHPFISTRVIWKFLEPFIFLTTMLSKVEEFMPVASSTISVYQPGLLQLTDNYAEIAGGGLYLDTNPRLNLLKFDDSASMHPLAYPGGGFSEGQQFQKVTSNCTELKYNIFSPEDSDILTLFPDGPCGSAALSIQSLNSYHFLILLLPNWLWAF